MNYEIVPIGKYKGQPLERLMADQSYSEWLLAQAWFVDRYAELANLLRLGRLTEPQDTPEHNAMIAGLIDQRDAFEALASRILAGYWARSEEIYCSSFRQELEPKGGDILIMVDAARILVEAKPLIGDDYPSVIRQVKSAGYGRGSVVIANKVETTNLSLQQVRRQFELAGVHLVLEAEFFEEGKAWAAQRAVDVRDALAEIDQDLIEARAQLEAANAEPPSNEWGHSWDHQKKVQDLTAKIANLNDRADRLRRVAV